MRLFPVIMAGGSGTRFWPLSRQRRPKQFLPLASERPLIADTLARVRGLASKKDVYVVCGRIHERAVRRLLELPKGNVLVEPVARNTAPAIALAVAHVSAKAPDGILAVLPSDQHVSNVPAFQAALEAAARAAESGDIVTLGIQPTRPETGYGYIHVGEKKPSGAFAAAAFVEKPSAEKAREYLASGRYLWNAGIFVFRADVMREAFGRHMPELSAKLDELSSAVGTRKYARVLAKAFPAMPSISIDYGVAERAENVAVVPGDFGWSDVGSFNALPEVRPADARGNVVSGKGAVVVDCDGCVVLATERPLAAVALTGMVVVDAGDAVLVVPKDKCQDVRKVVEALKARRMDRYL